jgi:hypothetical protein
MRLQTILLPVFIAAFLFACGGSAEDSTEETNKEQAATQTSDTLGEPEKKIENRKLTIEDFKGAVDTTSEYEAFTWWYVYYEYEIASTEGNKVNLTFTVWNFLGDESWFKKDTLGYEAELLDHEQGHYNFSTLLACDVKEAFEGHSYSKDTYREDVDSIFNYHFDKYVKLDDLYDEETEHMLNDKKQGEWNLYIAEELLKREGKY